MPPKCNHTRRPLNSLGTGNAVRYHQLVLFRLSGMSRMFSPYRGSGYTLLFTRVVSTVPGTVAGYQAFNLYAEDETTAPFALTWEASCMYQLPMFSAGDCANERQGSSA